MGNSSSMLTQYDIEELQEHCNHAFSQQEIVSLYHRFCQLDRNSSGFISGDEFLSVPEFAVNPLSQRLLRMLDGLNFKEFVAFLSAFSPRTSLQQKIEFLFKVYDFNSNGKVTFDDILSVLRELTGSFISEQQRQGPFKHLGSKHVKRFTASQTSKILYKFSGLECSVFLCQAKEVITRVLEEAGYRMDSSLVLSDFIQILGNSQLKMEVEVPID